MKFTMVVPDNCLTIVCTLICDEEDRLTIRSTHIEPEEDGVEVIDFAEGPRLVQ